MIILRREKLRNKLQQEMEEYQYEIYSNNGSQYLLDKFTVFNNYNNKNKTKIEDNINDYNINNQFGDQNYNMAINNQNFNGSNNYINNYNDYQNNQINNGNGYGNGNGYFNYGNLDIDSQINNYNDYYNKLKVDEFMSKKMIQDDLLNKINQKLMKINKDINDKEYQENLAAKWKQNNSNFQ